MGVIMINSKRLRYKTDIAGYKINCCIVSSFYKGKQACGLGV